MHYTSNLILSQSMDTKRKAKRIFFDYASITPVNPEVERKMALAQKVFWANPSSLHTEGEMAKEALGEARTKIARILHCCGSEIFFTSGGTEGLNIAILGVTKGDPLGQGAVQGSPLVRLPHIITTTIEALECIRKDSIPFIVALNKIDRPGANIDKIKQNLAENNVLVEGWGGTVPAVAISAKTGEGVPELLEMIVLQSDLEELKGDADMPAEGFVIESHLNPKQGASATLIIKNGSMKIGVFAASAKCFTPIRTIENYKGENISEASFSSPVRIFGWNEQPMAGQPFKTFDKKEEALEYATESGTKEVSGKQKASAEHFFEVVIKADTFGSLDAVEHELQKLGNEKIAVKIISKGVGIISENDVRTASIKKCLVLGFNVEVNKGAEILALRDKIDTKTYKIIYELTDYVREKMKENTPTEMVEVVIGSAKVLRIFSKNKDKQVIGCRVEEGEIKSGNAVKIFRRDALISSGKIKELQIQKIKTDIAKEGQEFGLMVESKIEISQGDVLKVVEMVRQ